ncbi:MAG: DUF3459 domain-containing protein, partial [Myxococcota bacterium]
ELVRLRGNQRGLHLYDSQWNDDFHHALHVATTGENQGHYYQDFADEPLHHVGRCLTRGFDYYGEFSKYRGRDRGGPYSVASPFAFCNFSQNHDQVGNRGLGDRLNVSHGADAHWLCATIAWLAPGIPMLWMGEESGTKKPFPFFGDYPESLAPHVREGRKRDHAGLPGFDLPDIPDPVSRETFLSAKLPGGVEDQAHADRVRGLLTVRRERLAEHYRDLKELRGEYVVEGALLRAQWPLSDGSVLYLVANFGAKEASTSPVLGDVIACTHEDTDVRSGVLPGYCAVYALEEAQ